MKRFMQVAVLPAALTLLGLHSAGAMILLTQDQAIKEMFPDADRIVTHTQSLSDAELTRIKARLGGSLVHFQKGSESSTVQDSRTVTFFVGMKKDQLLGIAVIEEQPGKWGPVTYIILLDPATARVKNLAVMSYEEKRGRPIARRNFLEQFLNKGSADPLRVFKDIRAISGATISSDATCFAVKKATVLVEELAMGMDKLAALK